jgi:hypothetical protein
LAGAWVRRDVEHLMARKVQDEEQMKNYDRIDQAAHEIERATCAAKVLRQRALDALEAGDPGEVRKQLLVLGAVLDRSTAHTFDVRELVGQGKALEAEDVRRGVEQTHESAIKIARISDARRAPGGIA